MTTEQLNATDCFAATNGIKLLPDGATAMMTVEDRHLNGAGVCQGGALFTLADLAAAGLTHGEKLTIDSEIHYLHAAKLGDVLTAKAEHIHEGRLALIVTEIRNQSNILIATTSARFVSIEKHS